MSCFHWLAVFFLALIFQAQAHVVPNMTIEVDFAKDHGFTLKMNLDPRVFLSDQPTSLPPVSADWYLNQSPEEKKATYEKATEYLKANVGLTFNDEPVPMPPCDFVALDGATYEAVKPDTTETHLLATAKSQVPAGADSFKVVFGRKANVSLILINGEEGNEERKPQVIFPGETSRPFKFTAAPVVEEEREVEAYTISEVTVRRVYPDLGKVVLIIVISVLLVFFALVFFSHRRKRR
ncbi:hypothetical protein WJU23_20930 [Prosthecobacter sp. SYSU 5D2]|uniref:hypothetical protein n=1 Tax=Prosthecobacter sp. SYSU 5D2 TaxID=3134134 RepID=UPI0031FED4D9